MVAFVCGMGAGAEEVSSWSMDAHRRTLKDGEFSRRWEVAQASQEKQGSPGLGGPWGLTKNGRGYQDSSAPAHSFRNSEVNGRRDWRDPFVQVFM